MRILNKLIKMIKGTAEEVGLGAVHIEKGLCCMYGCTGQGYEAELSGRQGLQVKQAGGNDGSDSRLLKRAQYIWTDRRLPDSFVKSDGQTIIFVWGKTAGEKWGAGASFVENKRAACRENYFRTFMMADYICVSDTEAWERVQDIYKLDGIYRGRILMNLKVQEVCLQVLESRGAHVQGDGKRNILIYAGNLDQQGITTAFCSMMEALELDRFHYYVAFRQEEISRFPEKLDRLPKDVGLIPMVSQSPKGVVTTIAQRLYLNKGKYSPWIERRLKNRYRKEWNRQFPGAGFSHAVQYCGYETYMILLFQASPCENTIWVHNNMMREIKMRHNQNPHLLRDAYQTYDHVVVVSEDIRESALRISGKAENIQVIGNCHDYRRVLETAEEPVRFDSDTTANVTLEELRRILDGDGERFINIGRYSPEKGHKRLLEAFCSYWKEHKDAYLIIIGGSGELYEETRAFAEKLECGKQVVLLRKMSNPMPVLKRCDLFILSSHYEGLGLVLCEADTLGIPVIACDVDGPRGLLKKYGGTLVEDSAQGLLEGMKMFHGGRVHPMNIDYEAMNREYIDRCEALLGR